MRHALAVVFSSLRLCHHHRAGVHGSQQHAMGTISGLQFGFLAGVLAIDAAMLSMTQNGPAGQHQLVGGVQVADAAARNVLVSLVTFVPFVVVALVLVELLAGEVVVFLELFVVILQVDLAMTLVNLNKWDLVVERIDLRKYIYVREKREREERERERGDHVLLDRTNIPERTIAPKTHSPRTHFRSQVLQQGVHVCQVLCERHEKSVEFKHVLKGAVDRGELAIAKQTRFDRN